MMRGSRVWGAATGLTVATALIGVSGCTGETGSLSVAVDTLPSGTVRVSNRIGNGREGVVPTRLAAETLRVDARNDEADLALSMITGLAVGPDGTIFVLDTPSRRLLAFGVDGRLQWAVGREGDGPGEFRQPAGLALLPSGDVLVVDIGTSRFETFGAGGRYLQGRPRRGAAALPWSGTVLADGTIIDLNADGDWVRLDESFAEIGVLRLSPHVTPTIDLTQPGGMLMRLNLPYAPQRVIGVGSDGALWVGIPERYELASLTQAGATPRLVSTNLVPPEVSNEERAAVLEAFGLAPGTVDIPHRKPAYKAILVDEQGALWVAPFLPGERDGTGDFDPHGSHINALDLFDAGGRFLFRLRLPVTLASRPVPVIRGRDIYGVTHDEFGVPSVVRLSAGDVPSDGQ